jgi:predicted RNA-binding Zn-ribbon protein involved in translation (DUF1610 family)
MSETKTFNCPSCGAALTTTGDETEVKCQFCGNTVIVPPELRRPRDPDDEGDGEPSANLADILMPSKNPLMTFIEGIVGVSVVAPLVITAVTLGLVGVVMCVVFGVVVPLATSSSRSFVTFPTPTRTPRAEKPTRTPAPAGTPTPTPTPFSKVLFQDDFGEPTSGWDRGTFDQNVVDYAPGGYHILLGNDSGGESVWVKDGFGDLSISVDAKQTAGPPDSWHGVLCRARKDVGAYGFEISTAGRYQIVKYRYSTQGSRGSPLERGDLSVPPRGDGPNQLRADCIGSSLTLWVNGRAVSTFKDGEFTSGGVGLIVETGASGKAGGDILFSHYAVKGP